MAPPRAGMLEAERTSRLVPLCGGGSGAPPPLPGLDPPGEGRGWNVVWQGCGEERGGPRQGPGVGHLRLPDAPALKFLGRCSSYKDDAGCARGTRGREAADEYGEEFAMGGACRGSPVLRCEPGHKETSALDPQDRRPEVSRRPILTAPSPQASLSPRREQPNPLRVGPKVPGSQAGFRGWQTLSEVPLIWWLKSLSLQPAVTKCR